MKQKITIQQITVISVVTAVLCICAPFTIPIGVIPLSMANLILFLGVYVLGQKNAVISCFIYLCIGFIGIPVYSGFGSGPGKLFGPTGGYFLGYLLMVWIAGFFIDRFTNKIFLCIMGMILGHLTLYLFGTLWLSYQSKLTFGAALALGVLPFLIGDFIKIIVAAFVGRTLRRQLKRSE